MTSRRSRFQVKPNTRLSSGNGPKTAVNNKNQKAEDVNADVVAKKSTQEDKNLAVEDRNSSEEVKKRNIDEKSDLRDTNTPNCSSQQSSTSNTDDNNVNGENSTTTSTTVPVTNDLTSKSDDALNKKIETSTVSSIKPPTSRARLAKPKPKLVSRIINNQPNKNEAKTSKSEIKCPTKDNISTDTTKPVTISDENNKTVISENVEPPEPVLDSIEKCNKVVDSSRTSASVATVNANNDLDEPVPSTSEIREERPSSSSHPVIPVNKPVHLLEPIKPRKKPVRRFKPGSTPPEKNKMKMMDLIFWNPLGKGMSRKSTPQPATNNENTPNTDNDKDEEENADNPTEEQEPTASTSAAEEPNSVIPGPRVMIGEDGQIIIDEASLIIEQTNAGNDISTQEVVYDSTDTTYASFKKPKDKINHYWTLKETAKFYKTLSVVGTDFTLMSTLFPERSRLDLKNKFKKEERLRKVLIDKAISEWHNFDLNDIEKFLAEEEGEQPDDPSQKTKKRKKRVLKPEDDEEDGDGPPPKTAKKTRKPRTSKKNASSKENLEEPSEIDSSIQRRKKRPHSLSPSLSASTVPLDNQSRCDTPSPTKRFASPPPRSCNKSVVSEATVLRDSPDDCADTNNDLENSPSPVFKEPSISSQKKVANTNAPTTSNNKDTNNQLSTSHPTLHSLLNKSQNQSSSSASATTTANINLPVGQLILVASRTPTNEQVVHVYLVSPNGQTGNAAAVPIPPNTSQSLPNNENQSTSESTGDGISLAPSTSGLNVVDKEVTQPTSQATKSTDNKNLSSLGIIKLKSP